MAGGILTQVCLGAIYTWSAFTAELTAPPFEFTRTQTQVIFSVGLFSFALVMALGSWPVASQVGARHRRRHRRGRVGPGLRPGRALRLGGYMGDTGSWAWAFIPAGVACLAAAGLALTLRPPEGRSEEAVAEPEPEGALRGAFIDTREGELVGA